MPLILYKWEIAMASKKEVDFETKERKCEINKAIYCFYAESYISWKQNEKKHIIVINYFVLKLVIGLPHE